VSLAYNAVMLISLLLAGVLSTQPQDDLTKTLTQDLSGVSTVVIDANVAEVHLVTGSGGDLRAKVVLDSSDEARLPQCAKSELRARRGGETLRLTLSQPGRKHCGERWTVEVPAGTALDVKVEVGSIDANLRGGYGDVEAKASVGRAELEIDGRKVVTGNEPGPSTTVRLEGDGPRLSLRSGVGNVRAVVSTRTTS
jgi:hypothetical protein